MTFAPSKPPGSGTADNKSAVDRLVLATVNAPYKRAITAATLQACLADAKLDRWSVHVASFFTDVAPDLVLGFARDHGVSASQLAQAYLAMKAKTGERSPALEAKLVGLAPSEDIDAFIGAPAS